MAAKATTARQAIFSPNTNAGQQDPASDSEDEQGDVDPENVDNGIHQVEEMMDDQARRKEIDRIHLRGKNGGRVPPMV